MIEQINDFEASRVELEKVLNRSKAQLSKTAAQISKKKAKQSNAAKTARTKKVALVADIAKKSTAAKTKRLEKIKETLKASSAEAKTLTLNCSQSKLRLKRLMRLWVATSLGSRVLIRPSLHMTKPLLVKQRKNRLSAVPSVRLQLKSNLHD